MRMQWKAIRASRALRRAAKAVLSIAIFIFVLHIIEGKIPRFNSIANGATIKDIAEMALGALDIFIALILGAMLCWCVFNIERLLASCKKGKERKALPHALYFSVSFALLCNPLERSRNSVTGFDRIMGQGIMLDVDVTKRIGNFYLWLAVFAASFALFYLLANYWKRQEKSEEAQKAEGFLDNFMAVANCGLCLSCMTYFAASYNLSPYLTMAVVLAALLYISLNLGRYIKAGDFAILLLSIASAGYSAALALVGVLEWRRALILIGALALACCAFLFFAIRQARKKGYKFIAAACASAPILTALPLITSLYIESLHILNQHGIFAGNPSKYYAAIFAAVILAFCGRASHTAKSGEGGVKNWKALAYPLLIAGIGALSAQMPISSVYKPHIFEGANAGILISDFLNFGKIPIVEHYGGHMMYGVWEGILYGILNQDYAGAFVSPYHGFLYTPIMAVLFFYLIKKVWNEDMALCIALLFPFYDSWSYYGLGMLACLAAMAYVNKNTYARAAAFFASCVWCALYRLDLGFAFTAASLIGTIACLIATRNKHAARQLAITFALGIAIGVSAWCILCLARGVNPVSRLLEFVMISLSNRNWAYSNIGNTSILLFSWAYLFIPFLAALALLYTVLSRRFRERIGLEAWLLLQILGWSYFINFQRGLVRHSVAEIGNTRVFMWSAYMFLAVFAALCAKNKKAFLPSFMALIVCNSLLVSNSNFAQLSLFDRFAFRQVPIIANWKQLKSIKSAVRRVEIDKDLTSYRQKFWIVDALLEENETFADFINKTLLYSLLGRECPSYVSQSPLQLSGEFAQVEFIKEIEACPIVLMPVAGGGLDGVPDTYRYYKVSEYIYQSYVPLCRSGNDYAIWCKPDKHEIYREKLSESGRDSWQFINYGYDGPYKEDNADAYRYAGGAHNYTIRNLPRIWAEKDFRDSSSNKVAAELMHQGGQYMIPADFSRGQKGNYLKVTATLDGIANKELDAVIALGRSEDGIFEEKARYSMTFKEGRHDYQIRCSTDYYWHTGEINAVKILSDGALRDIEMKILDGD